jgi:Ca-activated chloride channel family protein
MLPDVSMRITAAIQFLQGLRTDDNVAIYNFHSKIDLVQDFSNSRDIRDQAYELKAGGMTLLNDSVYKAAQLLSTRVEKRRAIIVLSDGADTMSGKSADRALKAALSINANIYTVDMNGNVNNRDKYQNQGVLKNFADKTGGRFIISPGGRGMREAFREIVEELGSQYTITFAPANTKKDGKWRSLELRVMRPNLTIRTRKGYNAPKT